MAENLETLGQLERRLHISLASTEIDSEVQSRLRRIARNVKMHGFRPGKVPLKVVSQQYENEVRREVLGDALQKSFGDAVRDNNLRVAGYPRFEAREGAVLEFNATFEIYPEVQLGDFASVALNRPLATVDDGAVDRTVEIMRKQRVKYETVDRAAAAADRVTIDYSGTIDSKPFEGGAAQGIPVVLGEGRLLGDFEKQIEGMASGAAKTFELRFPDDYHGKEVAGKTATFEVTLKEVGEPKLPPVDADFAKSLGVADGDLAKMRAEIKANLEREVKRRVSGRLKDQIMQSLIDTSRVEVPKSLVELEVERMTTNTRRELEARGVKPEQMPPLPTDVMHEQARRRVTLGLILGEVVKQQGLQAKPEQVRAAVEEQAQTYEKPEQVVKWYYQSQERLAEVESMVVEDNVVEWALRTAKVSDQPMQFDELMGTAK
jgi:trigger factor